MRILFVCTGNTCRSPMAEVLAKQIFSGTDIEVDSAGVSASIGEPASENAILAAKELGLDLSRHRSKQLTTKMIEDADLVLTMTGGHKQVIVSSCHGIATPIFSLAEYANGEKDVLDPFGYDLDIYRDCILEIKDYIQKVHKALS